AGEAGAGVRRRDDRAADDGHRRAGRTRSGARRRCRTGGADVPRRAGEPAGPHQPRPRADGTGVHQWGRLPAAGRRADQASGLRVGSGAGTRVSFSGLTWLKMPVIRPSATPKDITIRIARPSGYAMSTSMPRSSLTRTGSKTTAALRVWRNSPAMNRATWS